MSELTIALGRYEELVLHSTPCGEYVEMSYICTESCADCRDCIAGQNFLSEVI